MHGAHISHSGAELIPAREGLTGRAGQGLPWYGEEGYSPLPMPGRGHRAGMGHGCSPEPARVGVVGWEAVLGHGAGGQPPWRGPAGTFARTARVCAGVPRPARVHRESAFVVGARKSWTVVASRSSIERGIGCFCWVSCGGFGSFLFCPGLLSQETARRDRARRAQGWPARSGHRWVLEGGVVRMVTRGRLRAAVLLALAGLALSAIS